jgi:hypothetical protein
MSGVWQECVCGGRMARARARTCTHTQLINARIRTSAFVDFLSLLAAPHMCTLPAHNIHLLLAWRAKRCTFMGGAGGGGEYVEYI